MNAPSDQAPEIDVWERTKGFTGPAEAMDRRLFMQLLVFDCDPAVGSASCIRRLDSVLSECKIGSVVYQDANSPFGIGVLAWSESPEDFVSQLAPCFSPEALTPAVAAALRQRHDFTMLGRSYSTGYEPDLKYWLLDRPAETVTNELWPWAVWYPLRRSGAFARLDGKEQGAILREHAEIGKAYGAQDLAHDVRLACHGLDSADNEFVIGLIGKSLHPLSHVVQHMRKTRQTAEYISQMGPFFVGYAVSRHSPR